MASDSPMIEALRLVRTGNLVEATALIRGTLGGFSRDARVATPKAVDLVSAHMMLTTDQAQPAPRTTRPMGDFGARRHVGTAGIMDYMLYRPASAAPGMPLVVMLHGCTQSPEDFARGTAMNGLADELGFLVAYPRQTQAANPQKCWNWFRPGDQRRGCGEPALIAGLVHEILEAERADRDRVYVAGLSAGGAAAAIMADAYPDMFAAVGIHSGLACGAAKDLPSALAAMKRGGTHGARPSAADESFVPVITFHGDRDGIVHEANAREIVRSASVAAGVPVTTDVETGEARGRLYTRALSRDQSGRVLIEQWTVAGARHAWSGGDATGTYADATGPDASRAMLRFFLEHRKIDA